MTRKGYLKHKHIIEPWANGARIGRKNRHGLDQGEVRGDPGWADKYEYYIIPEQQTRTVWINVYEGTCNFLPSKADAEFSRKPGRIACVEIDVPFHVGEGLEDG